MSSHNHTASHNAGYTVVATLVMLGLISTSQSAHAGVLDDLGQSLLTQNGLPGGVISENPSAIPFPAQPTTTQPITTIGETGVISETAQSPIAQQAENVLQNGADGVVGGVLGNIGGAVDGVVGGVVGNIGGAVDGIFGHHSGVLGGIFNPFEQQVGKYISAAQAYLHNAIGDFLGSIFGQPASAPTAGTPGAGAEDGGIGVDTPPGAMGIPDPYAVQKSIEQNAAGGTNGNPSIEAQQADRFNVNPVVLSHSLSAEQNRTLGKTIAASVLSNAGQQAMSDERTAAAQTLQQIQAKAEEAQGLDVTQDVMKNLTAMIAGQSSLESGNYAQTMLIHQQLAATSVVESDISESLDEANRARHAEAMAGASGLLRSASTVYLPGS